MTRPRAGPLRTFLTALLYGVALTAALSNTVALLLGLANGAPDWTNVSLGLLGWGVLLYIHRRQRWPPFHA